MHHVRLALRRLRKSPGFTALVVLTLALGIGANTAIFSVVAATCLRALPYREPERLVFVTERTERGSDLSVSYPNFLDWRAGQDCVSGLAIYRGDGAKLVTRHGAEQVALQLVSADFFSVLGVHVQAGRDLRPDDDRVGAAPVAWLTHAAWQRYLGGEEIVGRTVMLDGEATTIAGILPPDFRFYRYAEIYVPIEPRVDRQFMRERENHNGTAVIGRLKPGVSVELARTQFAAIGQRLARAHPKANAGIRVETVPLRERLQGDSTRSLFLLLGAVAVVLMIACVNVANMLLARSYGRRREMAIRTALGATRGELLAQLLTESAILATLGGLLGAAIGVLAYGFVTRLGPWEMQELIKSGGGFDVRVALFIVALTLLTGVGFGLAPAWQLSHADPNDALKNARPTLRTWLGRLHLTDVLVVVQVGLAVTLLVSAGLLIRSLHRVVSISTGIQPDHVLTLRVATPPAMAMARNPAGFVRHHETVLAKVQALPEVESAAFASSLPYTWDTSSNWIFRPDRPLPQPGQFPMANAHIVTPEYFRTLGIPLLRGRLFSGREPRAAVPDGTPVSIEMLPKIYDGFIVDTVVSRRMAERYWPGEDPLGKTFQIGQPEMRLPRMRIVGVVGNTTQIGAERGEQVEYYCLLSQWPATLALHLAVRTRNDPAVATASVRAAIRAVTPDEPIFDVKLMTDRVDGFASGRRFNMGLFISFASTALLLACLGIYGVLGCVVGQRTREFGIRMALGAQRTDVLRGVIGRGLALTVPGVAIGLAVAWAASRLVQSQLFGISATDLPTYSASGLVLLVAAVAACARPAFRAAQVDPVQALRTE